MREKLVNFFSKIIEIGVLLLVFFLPLFFLPITSDAFEFPKQILLILGVSFLAALWAVKILIEGKVKIIYGPLIIPVLIFFSVFLISTIFSINRFSSIYGPYPRLHGGFFSLFFYIASFFVISNNIREKSQIFRVIISFCLSDFALAVVGILHFFNIFPLGNILNNRFATPTGSADATSIFLTLLLPFLFLSFFFKKGKIQQVLAGLAGITILFYIFLISQLAAVLSVFLIIILSFALFAVSLSRREALKIGIALLLCLSFLIVNNYGPVKDLIPFLKDKAVQHDIRLDLKTSWIITVGGLQDAKSLILGSGPGTYLSDFTRFKPPSFNLQPFWDLRFEKSYNEYLQLVSTIGLLGLAAFLFLLLKALQVGREFLRKRNLGEKKEITGESIFFAILLFFFISFFVPSVTVFAWAFWVFLALALSWCELSKLGNTREVELSLAAVQPKTLKKSKIEIFPWLAAAVTVLIIVPLTYQTIKIFRAETEFAKSFKEQQREKIDINSTLQHSMRARDIIPGNDLYRRTISSTALDLSLLGIQQNLLSDETKQQLLQLALLEGEAAVNAAPYNIFNWENLQRVYTVVSVEGNDRKLIENIFPSEILLDPVNPRHYNDRGWIYFSMRNNIEAAKQDFQRAINLKSDFTGAHYNLAQIYETEEKKDLALVEYERTLDLIDQQISFLAPIAQARPDLLTAFNQLNQLRGQVNLKKEALLREIEAEKTQPSPEIPQELMLPEEQPEQTEPEEG